MKTNKTVLFLSTFFLLVNGTALVAQQRSPGGGAATGTEEDYRRELERALNTTRSNAAAAGAWWMDPAIVSRARIDQRSGDARIEKIFETHRQTLTSTLMQLERDDMELKRLLEAETVDRAAIRAQVDRVIRSRSEMERANANMTLDMREQLSQAQWLALQAQRSQSEYLGELRRRTRFQ